MVIRDVLIAEKALRFARVRRSLTVACGLLGEEAGVNLFFNDMAIMIMVKNEREWDEERPAHEFMNGVQALGEAPSLRSPQPHRRCRSRAWQNLPSRQTETRPTSAHEWNLTNQLAVVLERPQSSHDRVWRLQPPEPRKWRDVRSITES